MYHTCRIFTQVFKPMLPQCLELPVFRQCSSLVDVDPNDVYAAVLGCTCKTMNSFQRANTFHLRVMLRIAVPRLARYVSLQSRRIPHLNSFIIRCGDEEHMVGGYGETRDRICMRAEVRDEICFGALMRRVARHETVSDGRTATDRSFMNFRPEVSLQILASIEVHVL